MFNARLNKCLQLFAFIGVLDKTETLTPLGERVSLMSCDPRLGKVLVLSTMFRCVLPMLSVAACLTRDPFYNSLQNRAAVNKVRCFKMAVFVKNSKKSKNVVIGYHSGICVLCQAKENLSGSSYSDYLVFIRAVLGWRRLQQDGDREDRDEYLKQYCLSTFSLRFING